ncbi:cysteine-rich receptor-like protein kinase, partial [Trifolium medium]|nr:cysteine-rich receptor-like protein kinase [Trifolium medium]
RRGNNGSSQSSEQLEFRHFVDLMEVVDVPVAGKKFTWFSSDGQRMSRLDRFLLSEGFIVKGGITRQWIGDRDISDHCPIWLLCNNLNWGPKPFKFFNCWLEHPNFKNFVENSWENMDIRGKKAFVVKEKFKRLKEALKGWNKEVFAILDLNIDKTMKELNEMEGLIAGGDLSSDSVDIKHINKHFWEQ